MDQINEEFTHYLYALRDSKVPVFGRPFPQRSKLEAIRSMRAVLSDKNTTEANHPEDFALFELGVYNERNGKIIPHPQPESVITLLELASDTSDRSAIRQVGG
jgi:hypothetical protein